MTDLEDLVAGVREKMAIEQEAARRFAMGSPAAGRRRTRYQRLHKYFAPPDGDQWPEDLALRPNKLHITANIVKAFCSVEARVLSIIPRISNQPPTTTEADTKKSEVVEELFLRYLEATGWAVWMYDRELMKSVYGKSILKPFWNTKDKRPDVTLVEQPENLLLGYGASDYSVIDWAIYRYAISATQAKIRWPEIEIKREKGKPPVVRRGADHTDPLEQKGTPNVLMNALSGASEMIRNRINANTNPDGEYEQEQLEVWDYWYLNDEGTVCNAIILQGCLVDGPAEHPEMPIIPYIVTEHDHEPGSPEGVSTAELLIDLQMGLNRVLSHFAQLVADNSGTAYQLTGANADSVPENIVPREDEIIPAGSGNQILPIQRSVNNFPLQQLIEEYWDAAHKITGLPEVMFGAIPGTQTSGRSMAVQIEAAQNRIGPKRDRSYEGLRTLLLFWGHMIQKVNPKLKVTERIEADPEGNPLDTPQLVAREVALGDFIKGFDDWDIIAPEITPRDAIEHTQNVIAKVQAKLLPRVKAMDELGIDNPVQMLALIESEESNASLNPGSVQAKLAAMLLVQQLEAQQAAQAGAKQATDQAAATEARMQQEAQEGAPRRFEDQNAPATAAGGAPPPGAPAPTGELQPVIRQTPSGESQAMSQVMLPRTELGI